MWSPFEETKIRQLAFSFIPKMSAKRSRILLEHIDDLTYIFEHPQHALKGIPGLPKELLNRQLWDDAIKEAELSYQQLKEKGIELLFFTDSAYPYRLLECTDSPSLIYVKGDQSCLSKRKIISIVGTRNSTAYGRKMVENIICELKDMLGDELLVVSGLAYGIDIVSHRLCLAHGVATAAVLAHGLHTIYPSVHSTTAQEMLHTGALISEFAYGVKPERYHFVARNRIVAGMSDATLVVESAKKGGSLITANLANSYDREVMAIPGRVVDSHSCGCNLLIKRNIAHMVECATDICDIMNWEAKSVHVPRSLFQDLTEEELKVMSLFVEHQELSMNELSRLLEMPIFRLSPLLFNLELNQLLTVLPGNIYRSK